MKVIVFGGAGDMGSIIVEDLINSRVEVTIADKDRAKAEKVRRKTGGKAEVIEIDARNEEKVISVMKEHDVVVSALGPFYIFEEILAHASIEAERPYISICDDYDAFEKVLTLDEKAKGKGVTVISGMGWTPGLSNILARMGYEKLGGADTIKIAWAGAVNDARGKAVVKHTLHIYSGQVPSYRNGKMVKVQAGSENETLLFPHPIGECEVANVGHPEPVSIPLFLKNVQNVILKGGITPQFVHRALIGAGKLHLMDKNWQIDLLTTLGTPLMKILGGKGCSGIRVEVEKGDRKLVYGATANMGPLTGIPASIVAQMAGRGEITDKGVLAPEACVEPQKFLNELGKRNIPVYEGEKFETRIA